MRFVVSDCTGVYNQHLKDVPFSVPGSVEVEVDTKEVVAYPNWDQSLQDERIRQAKSDPKMVEFNGINDAGVTWATYRVKVHVIDIFTAEQFVSISEAVGFPLIIRPASGREPSEILHELPSLMVYDGNIE